MTLEDLWRLTRRHFMLIGVTALIGTLLAAGWMLTRPKMYTATSQGIVLVPGGDTVSSSIQAQMLAQQRAQQLLPYFDNRNVAEAVIKKLNLDMEPEVLAKRVSASLPDEGSVITVNATAEEPRAARDIADAVVTAASAEAVRVEENAPQTTTVGPDGKEVKVENKALVRINLSQSALLPSRPSSPRPEQILPVGLLLGLILGYSLAAIRHRSDTRLRSAEDVETAVGSSVLGVVPTSRELGCERGDAGPAKDFQDREALRKLRTNLRFVDIDNQPRAVVVTSANVGEGKSTVASNIAWVLAESGERVVLVDADLRRPAVARAFDVDGSVGLSQVLAGTIDLAEAVQPTTQPNLELLTAGEIPPNPSELLGSHRMAALIEQLSMDAFVVLDAPPLLPVTDAALLTRNADGALIVVLHGKTRKEEAERTAAALRAVGAKVLGTVINRASNSRIDRVRYGDSKYAMDYGSSYQYEQSGSTRKDRKRRQRSSKTRLLTG